MSVLIKDVDMPKRCIECPLCQHISLVDSPLLIYACAKGMRPMYSHETAEGVDEFCKMQKPDWCPLVEVPTPHGRLIDLDKFLEVYPQFVLIPASSILLENKPVIEEEE